MKTKKVLSIDLDYVMAPSIELYNDCVGNERYRGDFWGKLNEYKNINHFLEYDEEKLTFIKDIVKEVASYMPAENILLGEEHDMILYLLCHAKEQAEEKLDVYNIDHHHDLFYSLQQKEEIERFSFTCCANWAYYLAANDKLHSYHWLKNPLSNTEVESSMSDFMFPCDFETTNEDIKGQHYDYMFICKSNEYLPKIYHHFYSDIQTEIEDIKGEKLTLCNTPYCVNGKSHPILR